MLRFFYFEINIWKFKVFIYTFASELEQNELYTITSSSFSYLPSGEQEMIYL